MKSGSGAPTAKSGGKGPAKEFKNTNRSSSALEKISLIFCAKYAVCCALKYLLSFQETYVQMVKEICISFFVGFFTRTGGLMWRLNLPTTLPLGNREIDRSSCSLSALHA